MVLVQSPKSLQFLIIATIYPIILDEISYNPQPFPWIQLTMGISTKQMFILTLLIFRPKQLVHSSAVKIKDLLSFQEAPPLAFPNLAIIGLVIILQLGNSYKLPFRIYWAITCLALKWSERISAVLLKTQRSSCVQDGINWELYIHFREAIMPTGI